MTAFHQILTDLRHHQLTCRELLALAERESQLLRQGQIAALQEIYQAKKVLLPRLSESLEKVRLHRQHWQTLTTAERAAQPEISFLIRQVQDLIMRVILLDRENEQGLLRRGLVPAREMQSVGQQRPHFVAGLYRRQQGA
jgi:flagellar biosynthesis/type III secretory pathway chaperone